MLCYVNKFIKLPGTTFAIAEDHLSFWFGAIFSTGKQAISSGFQYVEKISNKVQLLLLVGRKSICRFKGEIAKSAHTLEHRSVSSQTVRNDGVNFVRKNKNVQLLLSETLYECLSNKTRQCFIDN